MSLITRFYISRTLGDHPWPESFTDMLFQFTGASLLAQTVKRLPTMQETWVQSPGQEDPLEKEMATHSSTLAWKIPWMEKPGRLQSTGSKGSDRTKRLHWFTIQVH